MNAPPLRTRRAVVAVATSLALLLAACGDDSDDGADGGEATDESTTLENCGVEVEVEPEPERIFAINQTMIELTYALGAGDRVVANAFLDNTILSDIAADFAQAEYFDGPPSREQVIAAEADLIVAQFPDNFTDQQMGSRAAFEEMGIRTWLAEDQCPTEDGSLDVDAGERSFARNFEGFRTYARLLGDDAVAAAEELIAEQEAALEEVASRIDPDAPEPTVAFVQFGEGNEVLASGGGSTAQVIADAAGVENVFADIDDPTISVEALIEAAPDHLVVTTCCGADLAEDAVWEVIDTARQNPSLVDVPAVAEDRFIALPFTSLYAGVRNVDAVTAIAEATHPDA